jgi:hypothetical protein
MNFKPRAYSDIAAARKASILANAPIIAKGECHYCAWSLPKPALYCCGECASEFQKECAELAAPEA